MLLVRHGQASFGADDYDVLCETGWEQSRLLGAWLGRAQGRPPTWSCTAACAGTARPRRAMVDGAGWSRDVEVDAGWNEFDHLGVVAALRPRARAWPTGPRASPPDLDRRDFQRVFEAATARWSGGAHDDEYDESWPAFVARVRAALDRACARPGRDRRGGQLRADRSRRPARRWSTPTGADPASCRGSGARFNTVTANTAVTRVVAGSTGAPDADVQRARAPGGRHAHLPLSRAHINRLNTGSGACFITTDSGAHGSGGTHAEAFSFSIASTIARTPFSVDTIRGCSAATPSFISEAM